MRIGQFIDTYSLGGAEMVVAELSLALTAAGHEPVILHVGNEHLDRHCRRFGLQQRIIPALRAYKSTKTLPLFALQFARFLRREGIEALHAHLFGPVTAAAMAGRLAGIPTVGTLHDVYSVAEKPQRIRLLQLSALLGCRLVTVSENMRDFYRSGARFAPQQLDTVYNGVRLPETAPITRAELGLPADAFIVLCVGRLVELKRHELLIQAVAEVSRTRPTYLLCAGDGPRREALQQRAAELGMNEQVRFLGNRDDIPNLLRGADVFALASDTEGLSCSILESMAAGIPAVVTDVGGNRELIRDGETGCLVPRGDADALRKALLLLLDKPEQRRQMGRAAKQRARALFSLDAMTAAYSRLYGLPPSTSRGAVRTQFTTR